MFSLLHYSYFRVVDEVYPLTATNNIMVSIFDTIKLGVLFCFLLRVLNTAS